MATIEKLIQEDYSRLKDYNIPWDKKYSEIMLPRSIEGHAREGHSVFRGHPYPNITFDEIYSALKINPVYAKIQAQKAINEVNECIQDIVDGKKNTLTNRKGQPLFRFAYLEGTVIENPENFLKGVALAGAMDSDHWRKKTVEHYCLRLDGNPLEIGRGYCALINPEKLKEFSITTKDLANNEHPPKIIESLKQNGIILDENSKQKRSETAFIRTKLGLGCCDDASITTIGLIYGKDALLGAFCVDAVDTLDKNVSKPLLGGWDEHIGKETEINYFKKFDKILITPEEKMRIIYLGAKNNFPEIQFSSSHRRFCQIEQGQGLPTIFYHLRYVEKGKIPNRSFGLGFERVPTNTFYENLEKRLILSDMEEFLPRKIKKKDLTKLAQIKKEVTFINREYH